KLLFLGSSCIYPRLARQPMAEDELLTRPLEPTNQWYAIAKIACLQLGDSYDVNASHVIPALMLKMHRAKIERAPEVEIWGSGKPRREFLHVDDLADALVFLMRTWSDDEHVNIGTGEDVTSAELAELIARIIGFDGSAPEPSAYTSIHPCKTIGSGLEVQHRPVLLR